MTQFGKIESIKINSDSVCSVFGWSRAMRYNKKQLYTESVFMPLSTPTRFVKQNLESSKNFMRIVVIKSHYPEYPVNLSFCTIDSKLVYNESLTNESLYRLTKVIELTKVQVDFRKSYSTNFCPSSEATLLQDPTSGNIEYPLQWKLRVDPHSGNMVLIRQTPAVEIKIGKSHGTHHQGHRRHPV